MPVRKSAAKKSSANKDSNVIAFLGNDEAQVKEAALKRVRELVPADAGDFGQEIIDGTSENSEDAARIIGSTIEAVQTLPFFGGVKVVWLKTANFLGDSVTGRSQTTQNALAGLASIIAEGIPSDVKLVISATEIDKRRAFYKQLGKVGNVTVFDKPDVSRDGWEQNVMSFVAQRASEKKLLFPREALEFFVMLSGEDTRQINNEIEKLDVYVGDRREVTVEDVRQLVSLSRAGVIFEIGNAISQRNLPRALELIDHQIYRGESGIGILLAAIVPKVRNLLLAKDLVKRHRISASGFQAFNRSVNQLPAAETSHLPVKKDGSISCYPIFLASIDAKNFKLKELKEGLEACLLANRRLVTTQLDPKLVLNQLVVGLLTRTT